MDHVCKKCNKSFDRKQKLTNHLNRRYPCDLPNTREPNMKKREIYDNSTAPFHQKMSNVWECLQCGKHYSRRDSLRRHLLVTGCLAIFSTFTPKHEQMTPSLPEPLKALYVDLLAGLEDGTYTVPDRLAVHTTKFTHKMSKSAPKMSKLPPKHEYFPSKENYTEIGPKMEEKDNNNSLLESYEHEESTGPNFTNETESDAGADHKLHHFVSKMDFFSTKEKELEEKRKEEYLRDLEIRDPIAYLEYLQAEYTGEKVDYRVFGQKIVPQKLPSGTFECNFCGKKYSRKYNRDRHEQKSCDKKIISDAKKSFPEDILNLQNKIRESREQTRLLEEALEARTSRLSTVTTAEQKNQNVQMQDSTIHGSVNTGSITNHIQNSNNNNNNVNNVTNVQITINPFGRPDMSYLTDETFKKILNTGFSSVSRLIHHTHFNPKHPENHHVFISNMRDKHAQVYTGKGWELSDRRDVVQQMLEDHRDILRDKLEDLSKELSIYARKRMQRVFEKDDDTKEMENVRKDIACILYNQRKIPMNTKKELEGG